MLRDFPVGCRWPYVSCAWGWLRALPPLFGRMCKRPLSNDVIRRWTEPALSDKAVCHDLVEYAKSSFDSAQLTEYTNALSGFGGPALVLWSPENTVMPPAHGRRLAEILPRATYAEVNDAVRSIDAGQPTVGRGAHVRLPPSQPPTSLGMSCHCDLACPSMGIRRSASGRPRPSSVPA